MKDKWINDLKQKMSDHNEATPTGLWDDIESELFGSEKDNIITFKPQNSKSNSIRKKYWTVAACILILLSFAIVPLFLEEPLKLSAYKMETNRSEDLIEEIELSENIRKKNFTVKSNNIETISDKEEYTTSNFSVKNLTVQKIDNYEIQEKHTVWKPVEVIQPKVEIEPNIENKIILALNSFQMASNSNYQFQGLTTMSGEDLEVKKGDMFNRVQNYLDEIHSVSGESTTKITHKNPILIGASVNVQLNKNLFLNAGLSYSKLSSETHYGQPQNSLSTIQEFHYLGIPVNINYKLYEKAKLNSYAFTGLTLETPISGSLTTYVKKDEVSSQVEKERLRNGHIQVSANAGLGLGYNINTNLDISLEPVVRYHFKNNSEYTTLYQDKPINFNIRLGLKYTLKK